MNKLWACLAVVLLLTPRINALAAVQDEVMGEDEDANTVVYYWTENSPMRFLAGTTTPYYLKSPPFPLIHCNATKFCEVWKPNKWLNPEELPT